MFTFWLEVARHFQHKGREAAFVLTDLAAIEVDMGAVVHRFKAQEAALAWLGRCLGVVLEVVLEMARSMPATLVPLLAPRWADDTLYFTLWEAVLVAHRPA